MKNILITFLVLTLISCCQEKSNSKVQQIEINPLIGTWKLVYSEVKENDSIDVKDLTKSEFIKIINSSHFAFFNQNIDSDSGFYGGAGTYKLNNNEYIEKLDFIGSKEYRGHEFPFTIEIKGDTLIQHGLEEIKQHNIKRYILEKYLRIENK